jgi:hypothetical protein
MDGERTVIHDTYHGGFSYGMPDWVEYEAESVGLATSAHSKTILKA